MPRKDTITGCTVATTSEVFDQIAKAEGKNALDILDEMSNAVLAEDAKNAQTLKDNALDVLRQAVNHHNDNDDIYVIKAPMPVAVLSVIKSKVLSSFSGGKEHRHL